MEFHQMSVFALIRRSPPGCHESTDSSAHVQSRSTTRDQNNVPPQVTCSFMLQPLEGQKLQCSFKASLLKHNAEQNKYFDFNL